MAITECKPFRTFFFKLVKSSHKLNQSNLLLSLPWMADGSCLGLLGHRTNLAFFKDVMWCLKYKKRNISGNLIKSSIKLFQNTKKGSKWYQGQTMIPGLVHLLNIHKLKYNATYMYCRNCSWNQLYYLLCRTQPFLKAKWSPNGWFFLGAFDFLCFLLGWLI